MNITITPIYINNPPYFGVKKGIPITKEQVLQLRDAGLAEKNIAKELGVSLGYYYKQLKLLGISKKLSDYNDEFKQDF